MPPDQPNGIAATRPAPIPSNSRGGSTGTNPAAVDLSTASTRNPPAFSEPTTMRFGNAPDNRASAIVEMPGSRETAPRAS